MEIIDQTITDNFAMYHGDCVEVIKGIPDNSIHYSIFSPPFASLFTYSNSDRDMGNCKTDEEFNTHFSFLVNDLYRVIMNGRLVSVHCMNIPSMKERDGVIGLKDFRGDIIRLFQKAGFIYHSEVCIWKDPLIEATRTKSLGLMHKQIQKDSSMCRQGLPDYICTFRKPGENPERIGHPNGFESFHGENEPTEKGIKYSHNVWRRYADPIWLDIDQTKTLNYRMARDKEDERHICLSEGSLVLSNEGFKSIESINIGDLVLTHNGDWKPVIAKEYTGFKEVVRTKATGVPNLITTPTHKIWSRSLQYKYHPTKKFNDPEWKDAKDLEKCYVNQKLPPVISEEILTDREWWVVGRFLADGHVGTRNDFFISVGNHKYQEFEDNVGIDFFGNKYIIGNSTQFRLKKVSNNLKTILEKCGKLAHEKHVPIEGICLNERQSEFLLSGYLSGDGHVDKHGKTHATSVSRALLLGMSIVIQRCKNKIVSIYPGRKPGYKIVEGRKVNTRQEWIMLIPKDNAHHSFGKIVEDGAWKRVSKIQDAGFSHVWNIRVLDDESYTAEGCIVKNCPLQLQTIARCVELWTNKGDTVLSPFGGIGSEGYQSLLMGRKYIGIELKESYYKHAVKHLIQVENRPKQLDLFGEEII